MNWFNLLWNDGIGYNNHWDNYYNRIRIRYIWEHELITWFVKHAINHDVVAIDNYSYNYQTLIMKRVKEIWIIIYLH